jgi:hypothetical protein
LQIRRPVSTAAAVGVAAAALLLAATFVVRPSVQQIKPVRYVEGVYAHTPGRVGSSAFTQINGQTISCTVGIASWNGACSLAENGDRIKVSLARLPTIAGLRERVVAAEVNGQPRYTPAPQQVVDHWVRASIGDCVFVGAMAAILAFGVLQVKGSASTQTLGRTEGSNGAT